MRSLLVATALLTTGATAAFAQAQDAAQPPTTQPAPAEKAAPAPDAAPAPAKPATLADDLRPTFVTQSPSDMVASKLIGLTIQNAANETIGEIADVVLDEGAKVKSWVVGVGGFLGIGTKYVAIDPSAMKIVRTDAKTLKATINTDKDQLRAAPEYVYLGKEKAGEKK
ncbi:PRC-barrel domain-containing protein [Methylobacterium nigriterrae]|uniref:PRC-barrel domain-containing protein n=1 Tax=Methylobacterium nigriterrae TaxID=3127512 RepID=UPI0030140B30